MKTSSKSSNVRVTKNDNDNNNHPHIYSLPDTILAEYVFLRLPLPDVFRLELVSRRWNGVVHREVWPHFTRLTTSTDLSPQLLQPNGNIKESKWMGLMARCRGSLFELDLSDTMGVALSPNRGGGQERMVSLSQSLFGHLSPTLFPSLVHLRLGDLRLVSPAEHLRALLRGVATSQPALKTLALEDIDVGYVPCGMEAPGAPVVLSLGDAFAPFTRLEVLIFTLQSPSTMLCAATVDTLPASLIYLEVGKFGSNSRNASVAVDSWIRATVRNSDCRNRLTTLRIMPPVVLEYGLDCKNTAAPASAPTAEGIRLIRSCISLKALQLTLGGCGTEVIAAFDAMLAGLMAEKCPLKALSLGNPSFGALKALAARCGDTLEHLSLVDGQRALSDEIGRLIEENENFFKPDSTLAFPALRTLNIARIEHDDFGALLFNMDYANLEWLHIEPSTHLDHLPSRLFKLPQLKVLACTLLGMKEVCELSDLLLNNFGPEAYSSGGDKKKKRAKLVYYPVSVEEMARIDENFHPVDRGRLEKLPAVKVVEDAPCNNDLRACLFVNRLPNFMITRLENAW